MFLMSLQRSCYFVFHSVIMTNSGQVINFSGLQFSVKRVILSEL